MLRSSEIEAITEWHWSMATIFEFICYHVHVARWLRKWPKWAIGQLRQLSRAPDMSGKVRTTWISDDIGTCSEKKVWNSVSGKYRTSLHLTTVTLKIETSIRGHKPISDRTYICSLGVNFMQFIIVIFLSQFDFWSRPWIHPQIFWWIHIRKIKNCLVVTRLDVKLPKLRSPNPN